MCIFHIVPKEKISLAYNMLQETNINSAIIVFMMYSKGIQLLSFIIQEIQRVEFLGIWNISVYQGLLLTKGMICYQC